MIEHAINATILAGMAVALILLKRHRDELEEAGWYDE